MQKKTIFSLLLIFAINLATAQYSDQLSELKNHQATIYYSSGNDERVLTIANRLDKAIAYYHSFLGFKPEVTVLILSPADWAKYAKSPVYGMPHYNNEKTLIVASEDNAFWKNSLPPIDQIPDTLREKIKKVYHHEKDVSVQAFFDLLAIHELGHAFHMQAGLTMQRKWIGELFVNIFLHTYIAENEPDALPALTLFPEIVVAGGSKNLKYTHLTDIEERYDEIARQYPQNYGWYQCRWHSSAAAIYNRDGKQVLKKLWKALKIQKELLTDEELVSFLQNSEAASVADVMQNWDK